MSKPLAEILRTARQNKSLTQEQLAESLGVTPGAVYKWEALQIQHTRHKYGRFHPV